MGIESIISIIFGILFLIGFSWLHFIPFIMSIKNAKYLKAKEGKLTDTIWLLMVGSSIPIFIYIYLLYKTWIREKDLNQVVIGALLGFFCIFIFSIINQLYKNYISKDERKLPKS